MTYTGQVQNGVIVLDATETPPPEGAAVKIEVVSELPRKTLSERFKHIIGKAEGLPADSASRIDSYLYGDQGK